MTSDPHGLLAAYALDALDADENDVFEDHLQLCADCRSEFAGFRATAARLADAQPMSAPVDMWERVMVAIAATPQERPVVVAFTRRRRLRRTISQVASAAAVITAVVGVGAYAGAHDQANHELSRNVAITSVLTQPDSSTKSQILDNGGNIRVIYSSSAKAAVVATSGLPALGDGRVYQIWIIKGDDYMPQGVFATSASMVLRGAAKADRIAITIEPRGGSKLPTTAAIATIAV